MVLFNGYIMNKLTKFLKKIELIGFLVLQGQKITVRGTMVRCVSHQSSNINHQSSVISHQASGIIYNELMSMCNFQLKRTSFYFQFI